MQKLLRWINTSIRNKMILMIASVAIVLFIVLMTAARTFLFGQIYLQEQNGIEKSLHTIQASVQNEIQRMDSVCRDWSIWDDTYNFLAGQNPEDYRRDNLTDLSLSNLEVDYLIFFDHQGKLYDWRGFDHVNEKKLDLPAGFEAFFASNAIMQANVANQKPVSGIMVLPDTILLISIKPVFTSMNTGPASGSLLVGQILNRDLLNRLAKITGEKFSAAPFDPLKSTDMELLTAGIKKSTVVKNIDMYQISGSILLPDITGRPGLVLSILSSRDLYAQGMRSFHTYLVITLISALLSGVLIIFIVEKDVIRKLKSLNDRIIQIRSSDDLTLRVPVQGNNEISQLSNEINRTLTTLESSRHALLENQIQLHYEANHDVATRLPNRKMLMEKLQELIDQAAAAGHPRGALLFMDLDHFKLINDSYNHGTGDRLLEEIGQRIVDHLRPGDFLARFGGDEFVVLVHGVSEIETVKKIADRIHVLFNKPFQVDSLSLKITTSIGIAIISPTSQPEDLMRFADMAMYKAKDSGRAHSELYQVSLDEESQKMIRLSNELSIGLQEQQLRLYYQPILDASTGEMQALEALLRWQHPTRGLLTAGEFLPWIEETPLQSEIDRWVISDATRQLKVWQEEGWKEARVAINLSSLELQDPSFIELVWKKLDAQKLSPDRLIVEITEHSLLKDFETSVKIINDLRQLGVGISLDDFGTGYSSFTYLRNFPAEMVKIDRSFISSLPDSQEDLAIVNSIIALGHNLKMKVAAEGVETAEQLACLQDSQCDMAQGFLFCRAIPAAEIREKVQVSRELIQQARARTQLLA